MGTSSSHKPFECSAKRAAIVYKCWKQCACSEHYLHAGTCTGNSIFRVQFGSSTNEWVFKWPISLKKHPNLTTIARKFYPPCFFVLLGKFAFPFSYLKFVWFFCCYRFLHSCLGLPALKLHNRSRETFPLYILACKLTNQNYECI